MSAAYFLIRGRKDVFEYLGHVDDQGQGRSQGQGQGRDNPHPHLPLEEPGERERERERERLPSGAGIQATTWRTSGGVVGGGSPAGTGPQPLYVYPSAPPDVWRVVEGRGEGGDHKYRGMESDGFSYV